MAEDFFQLEEPKEVAVAKDVLLQKLEFDKIFLNCFNTPEGKRMFETLRERHVNVAIYTKGDTLEATSYRQGMADLVLAMEQCVDDALKPLQK